MSRYYVAFAILLTSCAAKTPQTILRNAPPWRELNMAFEVSTERYLGWGGPIGANMVLTVRHLGKGAPSANWEWRAFGGKLSLVWDDGTRDLALYLMDPSQLPDTSPVLRISEEWPLLGEEVYWNTHTWNEGKGLGRGWIVAIEDNPVPGFDGVRRQKMIIVDGFHHPGTSGSPVLRADGTMIGIALGGANWSCGTPWSRFKTLELEDQLECLFRRDAFPAEMMVSPVIGGVR